MKIHVAPIALCISACLMVGAVSATQADSNVAMRFDSETLFLQKYGDVAKRTAEGSYRIVKGSRTFDVYFDKAATAEGMRVNQSQIDALRNALQPLTPKQAGKLAELEQRQQQLAATYARPVQKDTSDSDGMSACGFSIDLDAFTVLTMSGGYGYADSSIFPAGSIPSGGWHAVIDLYATAAQSAPGPGLSGRVDDHINLDTYSNSYGPFGAAYAGTTGYNYCLRASGRAEVLSPSIWGPGWPNVCGIIMVTATENVGSCPQFY